MKILMASLSLALTSISAWAATDNVPGIPNFHQINAQVYRGGQPTDDGWKSLVKLGVKTVIDLRRPNEHDTAAERRAVQAAGMRYINVPMNGVVASSEAQILQVLAFFFS